MKLLFYILPLLFLLSCEEATKDIPPVKKEQQSDNTTKDTLERAPELVIEINREKARLYDASTVTIGKAVREYIFGDGKGTSIDSLLNEEITFRNNKGQEITIPLQSIIDTIHLQ